MLKFAKAAPYMPDPARSRPNISDEDRTRATEVPPQVVPFQCKPWLDGQAVGWTLFYGYVTPIGILGVGEGKIEVENLFQLTRETNQERVVDQFARGHFGIGTGYTLRTPPGFVSLILPPSTPPPGLETVSGVIETDWYPRSLFLVFRTPEKGVRLSLDYKMELARVVVIPRMDGQKAEAMSPEEWQAVRAEARAYQEEEKTTPSRWKAASGDAFTHLYKE
ncbi:MAG TPA: DUF6065 family protein, partial [Anaerolineales bacterium]|nr:DUF6065 family protein [Anaerolineales bacterium]